MEDQELLHLIQKNPEKGFEVLLDLYQKPLYWKVRKMVFSHEEAADVVQEAWIKIYTKLDTFKGNAALSTWMYRIAINEALNHINQKAKKQSISFEEASSSLANSLVNDPYFEGDEMQLIFQQAVATLPEKQRVVFTMKYMEEMKYDEIAEIVDTSVGALKSSYHLAVKKIEEYVKNQKKF